MYGLQDFYYHAIPALPEIILAVLGLLILLYGVITDGRGTNKVTLITVAAFAVTALVISGMPSTPRLGFFGSYVHDSFGQFMKLLVLLGGASCLAMTLSYNTQEKLNRFEFPVLILFSVLGMMFLISAGDLMLTYVGIELMSLPVYVLVSMRRDFVKSSEAGIKYFVLGALASGLILYGISMIYGFSGTVNFARLADTLALQDGISIALAFGMIMLLCGIAFKLSAVPFHMWTPDVYEGAPTSVTAFMAIVPKVAVLALLARFLFVGFADMMQYWQDVLWIIAAASMIIGAFAAIPQTNIKRLLAYSTIGHIGYALVGLTAGGFEGVRSMIIYIAIYMIMNIGVFAILMMMRQNDRQTSDIESLSGLGKTHPGIAFMMTLLMFSMAGIPPLAGFFSKLFVFQAAVAAELYGLAILGVLTSVVAAYYYLRIIKIMYFDEAPHTLDQPTRDLEVISGVATIFVVGFILFPGALVHAAQVATEALMLV